jgi:hypothetical protein
MGKPNMIKRADGSYSQRGLWDNIRANKGSGKAPTKEMLKQERKINAKYEKGGTTFIKDSRSIRKTTGKAINPNKDLKTKKYSTETIENLTQSAINNNLNPYTTIAQGLVETGLNAGGERNIGHVLYSDPKLHRETTQYEDMVYNIKEGNKRALNKGKKSEADIIQGYNGYGKLYPNTEASYHGGKSRAFYGVPVPKTGLNMNTNPLYGKEVIDIRDNVLAKNKSFNNLVNQFQGPTAPISHPKNSFANSISEATRKKITSGRSYKDINNTISGEGNESIVFNNFANGGKVPVSAGGEKHLIYKKQSPTGNGKGVKGDIMVTHPTMDKGKWDTIDLTKIAGANTVEQGIAATKKWHEENPEYAGGGITDNTPQYRLNYSEPKVQGFSKPIDNYMGTGENYHTMGFDKGNIGAEAWVNKADNSVYPYVNLNKNIGQNGNLNFTLPVPINGNNYFGMGYTHKFANGGINNPGFNALPEEVQQKILAKMAEGGTIHIKPENRGKFTAYKERTGKTTEEALHSPDPHVRQMANFARNAAKWHHADGGLVLGENMYSDGGMTFPKYRYENGRFLPMHFDGTTVGTPPPTKWGANFAKAHPNLTIATNMAPAAMEVASSFVNQNTDPELSGALDWGAKGASAGSAFGPWGTLIGGAAGAIGGGIKGIFDRQAMDTASAQRKIAEKNAADYKSIMGNSDTTNMGVIQANTGSGYAAFGGMKYNNGIYANGGMTVINRDHPNPQEEVEGGESAMLPNGKNVQFRGPKHTNGGIKTSLPEGTRIFSDQLIYPGKK